MGEGGGGKAQLRTFSGKGPEQTSSTGRKQEQQNINTPTTPFHSVYVLVPSKLMFESREHVATSTLFVWQSVCDVMDRDCMLTQLSVFHEVTFCSFSSVKSKEHGSTGGVKLAKKYFCSMKPANGCDAHFLSLGQSAVWLGAPLECRIRF